MNRFIRELRRREVFRTAGLYVGICWILIEVSSVMLRIFDAPEWIARALVIVTIVGFPLMLVLAWVYNVTSRGIEVQADPTDTIVPSPGSRKMDFVVMGVLSVALILSVYVNFTGGTVVVQEFEPLSVLVADFDNQTADPLFEGSLEQALNIGIEGASFITAYSRVSANHLVDELSPGTPLDGVGARLVAIREGIKIIVLGSISEDAGKYKLAVTALRLEDGEQLSQRSVTAKNKLAVLGAVHQLTEELREDLGDLSTDREGSQPEEMLSATSLQALKDFAVGLELANSGNYEESLPYFEATVNEDPNFGRALSAWAFSLFYLGRREESEKVWERALQKMGGMTARERLRAMGRYHIEVSGDIQRGIQSYSTLVQQYPADSGGHNSLANAYFSALDFEQARDAGRKALEIYPISKVIMYRSALYEMYAGDFAMAEEQARAVLVIDKDYYIAWLPIAISAAAKGDIDAARQHYNAMRETGVNGAALARLGKADLSQFSGDFAASAVLANEIIQHHEPGSNDYVLAASYLVLARSQLLAGEVDAARASMELSLAIAPNSTTQVSVALLSIEIGDVDAANLYRKQLSENAQLRARAYSKLVEGVVAMAQGRNIAAVDALRAGVEFADLWLIRFHLGRAYLQAGFFAEAMDEFMVCQESQGEASAVFLDDLPTWRYMATLPYWLGRAQQELGMRDSAQASFRNFLKAYAAEDSLTRDASDRLQ